MPKNLHDIATAFFNPDAETLYAAKGQQVVQLGTYASRCLDILLRENGGFVSNQQILTHCWREHGIEVSDASVRQTIALIRKSMSELGIDKKLLINAPGKGYALHGELIVYVQLIPAPSEPHLLDTPLPTEKKPVSKRKPIRPDKWWLGNRSIWSVILISVCISIAVGGYRLQKFIPTVAYTFLYKDKGVSIYSQQGYQPPGNVLMRLRHYESLGYLSIPPNAHIYVNSGWQRQNLAAFICSDSLGQPSDNCRSIIITGEDL